MSYLKSYIPFLLSKYILRIFSLTWKSLFFGQIHSKTILFPREYYPEKLSLKNLFKYPLVYLKSLSLHLSLFTHFSLVLVKYYLASFPPSPSKSTNIRLYIMLFVFSTSSKTLSTFQSFHYISPFWYIRQIPHQKVS